jgi:hypothetical protein
MSTPPTSEKPSTKRKERPRGSPRGAGAASGVAVDHVELRVQAGGGLEVLEHGLVVAALLVRVGAVGEGEGVLGVELQGAVGVGDGVLQAADAVVGPGARVEQRHVAGRGGQALGGVLDGLAVAADEPVGGGAEVARLGVGGVELGLLLGAPVVLHGELGAGGRGQARGGGGAHVGGGREAHLLDLRELLHHAVILALHLPGELRLAGTRVGGAHAALGELEDAEGVLVVGVQRERLARVLHGLEVVAEPEGRHGAGRVGGGAVGRELGGALGLREGAREIAHRVVGARAADERVAVVRVVLQGALGELAALVPALGAAVERHRRLVELQRGLALGRVRGRARRGARAADGGVELAQMGVDVALLLLRLLPRRVGLQRGQGLHGLVAALHLRQLRQALAQGHQHRQGRPVGADERRGVQAQPRRGHLQLQGDHAGRGVALRLGGRDGAREQEREGRQDEGSEHGEGVTASLRDPPRRRQGS